MESGPIRYPVASLGSHRGKSFWEMVAMKEFIDNLPYIACQVVQMLLMIQVYDFMSF